MNALAKWNPFQLRKPDVFRELEDIERRLEWLFERGPFRGESRELLTGGAAGDWSPMVDISEDDKEYVLKADLPEIPRGDVKVNVRDGVLEISGERKSEREEKGRRYHRVERNYGSFTRSFSLPPGANADGARASFSQGVLTVRIPKTEKGAGKPIEVKVE